MHLKLAFYPARNTEKDLRTDFSSGIPNGITTDSVNYFYDSLKAAFLPTATANCPLIQDTVCYPLN
jgi:hypothetical protein